MRPTFKFHKFFNISATVDAREFKFSMHTFYEDYNVQKQNWVKGA